MMKNDSFIIKEMKQTQKKMTHADGEKLKKLLAETSVREYLDDVATVFGFLLRNCTFDFFSTESLLRASLR